MNHASDSLRLLVSAAIGALTASAFIARSQQDAAGSPPDEIRAQRIVLTDEAGNERIRLVARERESSIEILDEDGDKQISLTYMTGVFLPDESGELVLTPAKGTMFSMGKFLTGPEPKQAGFLLSCSERSGSRGMLTSKGKTLMIGEGMTPQSIDCFGVGVRTNGNGASIWQLLDKDGRASIKLYDPVARLRFAAGAVGLETPEGRDYITPEGTLTLFDETGAVTFSAPSR